jgi:DNA relaxase NicK
VNQATASSKVDSAGGGLVTPPQVSDGQSNQGPLLGVAILDWLSFTLPVDSSADMLLTVYKLADILGGGKMRERGMHGYISAFQVLQTGVILWHPEKLNMGVHVSLPSKALALLPELGYSAMDILKMVVSLGGKPTRLDIAIDTDQTTVEEVEASYDRGEYVGKMRNVSVRASKSGRGRTLYFGGRADGKRGSNIRRFARVYDKAAEQNVSGVWSRAEVEFRHEHAGTALTHILAGKNPAGLILSTIDFRQGDQKNTDERLRLGWWSAWVGAAERVCFAIQTVKKTIEEMYEWVKLQCGPTLAALMIACNYDKFLIFSIVDDGLGRLKDYRRFAARKYLADGYSLV